MKTLVGALLICGTALLSIPLSASAAEYKTFVGCDDLAENPIPEHVCLVGDFPGAYFESSVETEYEVCVEFPSEEVFCSEEEEEAEADVLYINSITIDETGNHFVSWYVEGVEVGSWTFRVDAPTPPSTPIAPAPVVPAPVAPAATLPAHSAECLKAQQRIRALKGRLRRLAAGAQKTKTRAKLKNARSAAKRLC
jgi:hypothetical protein